MRLNKYDLDRALKILPEEVKALLIARGRSLVVAGGFLRAIVMREHIKDIDLFSVSREEAATGYSDLLIKLGDYKNKKETIVTDNAFSVKDVHGHFVQFIHRWTYEDPEKLINSFDFTLSRAAMWYDSNTGTWDSVVDDAFYEDLAAKRITFRFPERIEEPAGSLMRVLKFVKMGYHINSDSLAGVIAKVVKGSRQRDLDTGFGVPEDTYVYESIRRSICNMTGES